MTDLKMVFVVVPGVHTSFPVYFCGYPAPQVVPQGHPDPKYPYFAPPMEIGSVGLCPTALSRVRGAPKTRTFTCKFTTHGD